MFRKFRDLRMKNKSIQSERRRLSRRKRILTSQINESINRSEHAGETLNEEAGDETLSQQTKKRKKRGEFHLNMSSLYNAKLHLLMSSTDI